MGQEHVELSNKPRGNIYEHPERARETWIWVPLQTPTLKEIRQFKINSHYNHPNNMYHGKHCNAGQVMLAVKRNSSCFKGGTIALCKVLHKDITQET